MLAEYLAPLPTAIVCTMAVCTGTGRVSAASCCLHPIAPSRRGPAMPAAQTLMMMGFITSLFPKRFLEQSFCIPEGKQALFVIVVGVRYSGLLLQHVA